MSDPEKKTIVSLCKRDEAEHKTCLCFLRKIENLEAENTRHREIIVELVKFLEWLKEDDLLPMAYANKNGEIRDQLEVFITRSRKAIGESNG